MEVLEMEKWRIEVDDWYFDDLEIWVEEDVQTALDAALMIVEDSFGRKIRNYYICPKQMVIKIWIGLFK